MDADRRQRLLDLFDGPRFKNDRAKLIRESGVSKGRISQLFDPRQAFGERAARDLAARLALPPNYFDLPYATQPVAVLPPRVASALPPSPDFEARDVSDSEYALLEDLRVLPEEEIAVLRDRAAKNRMHVDRIIQQRQAVAFGETAGEVQPPAKRDSAK